MKGMGVRDIARLGLLSSMAVILFVVESQVPKPLPWMKLGLGNLPVLVALLMYGTGAGLGVSAVKLLVGGLLSGGLGGPAFVIGGSAGLTSLFIMAAVRRLTGETFSPVGVSIWGALTHQLVQLSMAALYVGSTGIFSLLPLFVLSGLLGGGLIGLLASWAREKLEPSRSGEYPAQG